MPDTPHPAKTSLRIGVICPEVAGHLNPMVTVCRILQQQGHHIVFVGPADGRQPVESQGFSYRTIGSAALPLGSLRANMAELSRRSGWAAFRYTMKMFRQWTQIQLEEAPQAFAELKLNGLICDQTIFSAKTLAERSNIPMVSLCGALLINVDRYVPLCTLPWQFRADWWGDLRNRIAYRGMEWLIRPVMLTINSYRRRWGLARHDDVHDTFSDLAQITQIPPEFDFPRTSLAPHVHYVGPLHDKQSCTSPTFDFRSLNDRPLVYASFGTLQNGLIGLFHDVASACAELPVQLILTKGGNDLPLGDLPGNPVVLDYAPQLEFVKRACLTVSHGGLNTVMESLSFGVPVIAVPIANDQPGVAARVQWSKVGLMLSRRRLNPTRLKRALRRVLNEPQFTERAQQMRTAIERTGGGPEAASIIERALRDVTPVARDRRCLSVQHDNSVC